MWSPAWVCWRNTDDCFGWAPLPPGTTWTSGAAQDWDRDDSFDVRFGVSWTAYTFVNRQHFGDRHWHHYAEAPDRAEDQYRHSKPVHGALTSRGGKIVNAGAPIAQVERSAGHGFPPQQLERRGVLIAPQITPMQTPRTGPAPVYVYPGTQQSTAPANRENAVEHKSKTAAPAGAGNVLAPDPPRPPRPQPAVQPPVQLPERIPRNTWEPARANAPEPREIPPVTRRQIGEWAPKATRAGLSRFPSNAVMSTRSESNAIPLRATSEGSGRNR